METGSGIAVRVGIFIVVGMALLLLLSLRIDATLLKGEEGDLYQAVFENVKGLEKGSPVMLSGLEVGVVRQLEFDSNTGEINATLFIKEPYRLKQDTMASIRLQSLLGQYYVSLAYGDPSAPFLKPGEKVETKETIDIDAALKTVTETGEEIKKLAEGFNENQGRMVDQLTNVIQENRDDLKKATEAFAAAGPKLDNALTSVNEIIADVKSGRGSAGKFLTDDNLYYRLTSATDSITSLTADIRQGDGTLSRLLYSDDIVVSAEKALKKIRDAADNMDYLLTENRSKITDFMNTVESTGPKLETAMQNLSNITEKINEGDGTLSRMINDPSLYEDVEAVMQQLEATFEEQEEQSVVRTVLSVIFGPAI